MVAGTRDRPEITHVQLGHPQISFPPDHVHWIEGVDHPRRVPLSFDVDLPLLALCLCRFHCAKFRCNQDSLVEQCMLTEWSAIRHRDRLPSFNDEKERRTGIDVGSIGRSFGDYHVIAWLVGQSSVVRFKSPCALMHEVRFVSIRIPYEVDHRRSVD